MSCNTNDSDAIHLGKAIVLKLFRHDPRDQISW